MQQVLTPKQVARSIGVSESSLKRWCDRGVIRSERTVGGHRRIRIGDVLHFLRDSEINLVQPEVLGLPPGTGVRPRVIQRSERELVKALLDGDEQLARRLVFDLYINGASMMDLCDNVFTPALHEIGEQWDCGSAEVYQERRACEFVGRLLVELRAALPRVEASAPLAIGGTISGDEYRLPTQMVELVLTECGWQATSLGNSLPWDTLLAAAKRDQPTLVWLSVSHVANIDTFLSELRGFRESLPITMKLVVGGQALAEHVDQLLAQVVFCQSFADLRAIVSPAVAS